MFLYNKLFKKIAESGYSQKEFCKLTGVSTNSLNSMANATAVSTDTIDKICLFFDCMPSDLYEWVKDPISKAEVDLLRKQSIAEGNFVRLTNK